MEGEEGVQRRALPLAAPARCRRRRRPCPPCRSTAPPPPRLLLPRPQKELAQLAHPKLLGGATIGDELALLRKRYVADEARYEQRAQREQRSEMWCAPRRAAA